MKKQLFIDIPDSPKEKNQNPKKRNSIPSDQDPIKQNNSNASLSSEESPQPYKSSSKPEKGNVVQFQQFKIDQPSSQQIKQNIKQIQVQIETPKDQVIMGCSYRQPPAPTKGSSKTKVFAFPGQRKITKQSSSSIFELQKQLQECKNQLLFKNGQISMLEKFISEHLGKKSFSGTLKQAQKIIKDKDEKIVDLLQRVGQYSTTIRQKSDEVQSLRHENYRLKSEISSLQNEVYILNKKQSNRESTRQFYQIKRLAQQKQGNGGGRYSLRQDTSKNIDQLQKRLTFLKNHNLELQISKGKQSNNSNNNDSLWMSQTSTNREKRTIDFRMQNDNNRRKHIKHY